MKRVPISSRNVTMLSLPHQMGEGRGEGCASRNSACEHLPFRLGTFGCLSFVREDCERSPLGLRNDCGNCCDRDDWRDTNSGGNFKKGITISTFIAWRPNLRLNSMVSAMAFLNSKNMILTGMVFSQLAAFWSNVSGIISFFAGKVVRTLRKIFGQFCKLVFHILTMSCCRSIGGNRTNILKENPHPDPLPSDGRGGSNYPLVLNFAAWWFDVFCSMEGCAF